MESGVRAPLEQRGLILVSALIIVVPELVIDHLELVVGLLDTHLDAQVVAAVEVPGAGVTDDVAVARFCKLRPLPERVRQPGHAK